MKKNASIHDTLPDALKRRLPLLLLAALVLLAAVFLWPTSCAAPFAARAEQSEKLCFNVVTTGLAATEEGSEATIASDVWLIDTDSDEYQKILEVLGQYRCHRTLGFAFHKSSPFLHILNSGSDSEDFAVTFYGANDFTLNGTTYTLYGSEDAGQTLVEELYAILQTVEPISSSSAGTT